MTDQARYFRVGVFVLSGLALLVAFVLVLGGGSFLKRPIVVETVFDESVQGLEVGSAVKLRGVNIGSVDWIGFVGDAYDLAQTPDPIRNGNRVLVRMNITGRSESGRQAAEVDVEEMIAKGLRVQLIQNPVTGIAFVQADYLDPQRYPPPQISWTPESVYVPSAPSTITQLSSAADRLMMRINKLDVEGLLTNLDKLLVNVNTAVEKTDVEGIKRSFTAMLDDARQTSAELRATFGRDGGVNNDARQVLARLASTLGRIEQLVEASGEELGTTLENLRVASSNLRDASETARSYPSLLLFGQPPEPASSGRPNSGAR